MTQMSSNKACYDLWTHVKLFRDTVPTNHGWFCTCSQWIEPENSLYDSKVPICDYNNTKKFGKSFVGLNFLNKFAVFSGFKASVHRIIKSSKFAASVLGISRMGSGFITMRWFKLPRRVWIHQQIFNRNRFHVTLRIVSPYICKQMLTGEKLKGCS